jgi:tetratricopeptide (TPR) repeat protein
MALSLPLVMILMDFYLYTKNFGVGVNKKSWREKIPFFLLAVAFGVVALLAKRATGHLTVPEPPFSIANFFIGSFRLVFYYLPRLFFMFNFTRLHPHNSYVYEIGAAIKLPLIYWLSPFILAALLAGSVFVFRKNRPALFGLLFFLVTFSPVLPLVAVGIFADRYLYIPSLGIFYLMGMGAWRFYQKLESRGKILSRLWIGLLVLACGFSASLTWQKCGVWKNSITLYDEACRWYPSVAAAFQHRGLLYFDRYENEKALMDFNRSLELDPEFADAFNSRGNLFARLGMLERAISDYRRAVNMKPEDVTARTNLGFLLSEVGKNQEAIMVLNQAIELKPDSMEAYHNRGNAYMQLKKYDRALADYNRALQISPDAALTYFNRSQVFFMRGAYRRALQDVEKARSLGFNVDPSVIKMLREKLGGK